MWKWPNKTQRNIIKKILKGGLKDSIGIIEFSKQKGKMGLYKHCAHAAPGSCDQFDMAYTNLCMYGLNPLYMYWDLHDSLQEPYSSEVKEYHKQMENVSPELYKEWLKKHKKSKKKKRKSKK